MDAKNEIREFLTSRRAKITPDQVGLASYGARRVPGLRRPDGRSPWPAQLGHRFGYWPKSGANGDGGFDGGESFAENGIAAPITPHRVGDRATVMRTRSWLQSVE